MKPYEKKGWFRLAVPDGWEIDEAEEPLAFYDPQGVGALQVTVQAPRPLKPGEKVDVYLMLRAFLRSIGVDIDLVEARRYTERALDWAACEYEGDSEEGKTFWRVWMATNHDLLAFITYACPVEERESERETVNGIVSSFELR